MIKNYIKQISVFYLLFLHNIIYTNNNDINQKVISILKSHGFSSLKSSSNKIVASKKNNKGKQSIEVEYNLPPHKNNFIKIKAQTQKHSEKKGENSYFESHTESKITKKQSLSNQDEIYQNLNSVLQTM